MYTYGFTGPPAVTVNIMKITESLSIVVQWDEVDDSLHIGYTVQWTDDRDFHGADTVDEQTSYTITGLALDTVYTITVSAANRCGSGPEFSTSISFSNDTTSTTSTISPTVTADTNPMTNTVNPSSTGNPSTATMTTTSTATTVNRNADISVSRNSDTSMTTSTTTSFNIATNIATTSKFSTIVIMIVYVITYWGEPEQTTL